MVRYIYIVTFLSSLLLCYAPAVAATVKENDIMIILSNSDSMKNHDPESSTLQAISRFIKGSHDNTRVAILGFNEYVTVISPLTHIDLATIDELNQRINAIQPQGMLSNAAAAVERSIYELKTQGRAGAKKIIILITDTTIHTANPNDDYKFEKWLREILVNDAAETGIQVFGIAIGKDADVQSLQILANKTDGDYYQATAAHQTLAALDQIQQDLFNEGQKLAQATEYLAIPPKKSIEPPPLQTATSPEMHAEEFWQSPITVDEENQTQQPRSTDIDPGHRAPAHSLEPKTADPESPPQVTAVKPTHVDWTDKNSVLLITVALMVGLATVIGILWALRRRKRTVLKEQNSQSTHDKLATEAETPKDAPEIGQLSPSLATANDKSLFPQQDAITKMRLTEPSLETKTNLEYKTSINKLEKGRPEREDTEKLPQLADSGKKDIPVGNDKQSTAAPDEIDSQPRENLDNHREESRGDTEEIAEPGYEQAPDNHVHEHAPPKSILPGHKDVSGKTVIRSEEFALPINTDDKTTIHPSNK